MKIGIISDTHDHVARVEAAVALFNARRVEAVLHCGDFVAPFSLAPFRSLSCGRLYAVFGNNGGEKAGLRVLAQKHGWQLETGPMAVELGGRTVAMMHEPHALDALAQKERFDLLAFGHLHTANVERRNGTLIVNPGEACGWTTGTATLAIVDLDALSAEIVPIG